MRNVAVGVIGSVTLVWGCGVDAREEVLPEEPIARIDLRAAFNASELKPVGIAITPAGRFILDQDLGLYRLTADGAVPVVSMSEMPDPGTELKLPFTDVTAVAPGVFALTAIGDGFLLDIEAMTLAQHFCYLPEGSPVGMVQRTDAIAYDVEQDKLYAQPVSFTDQGAYISSEVASYHRYTGENINWTSVGKNVASTAMAVIPDLGIVLAQDDRLEWLDLGTSKLTELIRLAPFGVVSIDGLAVDRAANTLVIVDSTTDELVEIDLARLTP